MKVLASPGGRHRRRPAAVAFVLLLAATPSAALIPTPVGGHAGEFDLNFRASFERGKVEPNENVDSFQAARWNVYALGIGYTLGDWGPLQDSFLRVEGAYVVTPSERNEHGPVPPANCLGTVLDATHCEFYPEDNGGTLTLAVGANLVHGPQHSFGFFLQGTLPIELNLDKFVTLRVDNLAGGVQTGVQLTPLLSFESRLYLGSGTFTKQQNATLALTNLFGLTVRRSILPWKAGLKFGTYVDGDLSERFDDRYDAAFSAPGRRDRIRMLRVATVIAPYFQVTEQAAIELSYVQKLFGYDTPATQFYTLGARVAF